MIGDHLTIFDRDQNLVLYKIDTPASCIGERVTFLLVLVLLLLIINKQGITTPNNERRGQNMCASVQAQPNQPAKHKTGMLVYGWAVAGCIKPS
jgi:hypothetical protein